MVRVTTTRLLGSGWLNSTASALEDTSCLRRTILKEGSDSMSNPKYFWMSYTWHPFLVSWGVSRYVLSFNFFCFGIFFGFLQVVFKIKEDSSWNTKHFLLVGNFVKRGGKEVDRPSDSSTSRGYRLRSGLGSRLGLPPCRSYSGTSTHDEHKTCDSVKEF